MTPDVFDDLEAEYGALSAVLARLSPAQWASPSGAPGWSVADVVLHLALTEELVEASASAPLALDAPWRDRDESIDDVVARQVAAAHEAPEEVLARWEAARRRSVATLREADPGTRLAWAEAPLKPATLATTRLAEHWAHALDVTGPLDIAYPDTDRLRHIAWLGHATLPYAFARAGLEPQPVWCRLVAPSGAVVELGPADAPTRIEGAMGAFCRVGARRLPGEQAGLRATGPAAADALRLLRNYAA